MVGKPTAARVCIAAVLGSLLIGQAPVTTARAATPGPGATVAALTNRDGSLSSWQSNQGFHNLGGGLLGAPAVVAVPNGTATPTPMYVGVGGDRRLWVRTAALGWAPLIQGPNGCWDSPGATLTAAAGGYVLTVACMGGDRALYSWATPVSANSLPVVTDAAVPLGGSLAAGPAVTSVGNTVIYVVTSSANYAVYSRSASTGYSAVPAACYGHPAVVSDGSIEYLACHGLDHALWYSAATPSRGWLPFMSAGGLLNDGPGVALTPTGATIFVEGTDTQMYHTNITAANLSADGFTADGGSLSYGAGAASLGTATAAVGNAVTGGVMLDGVGGLHPFGGLALNTAGAPSWPGADIARSVEVREDGSGGWTLDGYGGVHQWGSAAPTSVSPTYYPNDIARQLVVTSRDGNGILDGRQGYVLTSNGGVNPFGGAPYLTGFATWNADIARGLQIHTDANGTPDGGVVVDLSGGLHPFGTFQLYSIAPGYWPNRDLYQRLHVFHNVPYVVDRWGPVTDLSNGGLRAFWGGYSDYGATDIVRDITFAGRAETVPEAQPSSQAASTALLDHILVNRIGVTTLQQGYPLDCESAALKVAMSGKGITISEDWVLNQMGADLRAAVVDQNRNIVQWGDAWQTFVGDVRGSESAITGYGVYYPPIAQVGRMAGRPVLAGQGWPWMEVYLQLARGNPVVIWTSYTYQAVPIRTWTAWDGATVPYTLTDHAVTLFGVDGVNQTVTLADVGDGRVKTFSMNQFQSFFSNFNNMAAAVQ